MKLVDRHIKDLCVLPDGTPRTNPLITPFDDGSPKDGVISYGLSSCGYDIRLADDEIKLFRNSRGEVIDPKRFRERAYADAMFESLTPVGGKVIIPPNSYILGRSYEYFRVPLHLDGACVGKSSLARAGVIINVTPLEPMWQGHLTLEISNSAPAPAVVYVMEGIAQIQFHQLAGLPDRSYANKNNGTGGIYQGQTGVVPPRVWKEG